MAVLHELRREGALEVLREQEHADVGHGPLDVEGRHEALVAERRGHADVHHRHVRPQPCDLPEQRLAVGGQADDVHAALAQHRRDPLAQQRRVVGDHEPQRLARVAPAHGTHAVEPAEPTQLDVARGLEPDVVTEARVRGHLRRHRGDEHLAAPRERGDPPGLVDHVPVEVAVALVGLADVQAHPRTQPGVLRLEGTLHRDRAGHRRTRPAERQHVTVAQALDLVAAVQRELLAHERLVAPQVLQPARLTEALEVLRRALDVGEQHGDRRHARDRRAPWEAVQTRRRLRGHRGRRGGAGSQRLRPGAFIVTGSGSGSFYADVARQRVPPPPGGRERLRRALYALLRTATLRPGA